MENMFSKKVKIIQIDHRGEFSGHNLKQILQTKGITQRFSAPYTPEQHSIVERKHRHIVETGRCLLHQASLPYNFWVEAFKAAIL